MLISINSPGHSIPRSDCNESNGSTLSRTPELNPHNYMQLCVLLRTHWQGMQLVHTRCRKGELSPGNILVFKIGELYSA